MIDQNIESDEKVWRYMDFVKFMSILVSKTLFFPRSDMFEDSFEGTFSRATVSKFPQSRPSSSELMSAHYGSLLEGILSEQPKIRRRTFISCWHLSEYESAAMWKLYSSSDQSIAIVTRFGELQKLMPSNSTTGKVSYINFNDDFIPIGNPLTPFFRKRMSFEHEKEVRVVIQNSEVDKDVFGICVPFDISETIDAIYISPSAPDWYHSTVNQTLLLAKIDIPVHKSGLDQQPLMI